MNNKTYLGDAVYAEVDRGMIKLTTQDGVSATNTIYLELDVMENLIFYYESLTTPAKDNEVRQ